MADLKAGANAALTQEVPSLRTAVLAVAWDAASDRALDESLVVAVVLVGADGRVRSDADVVFPNQVVAGDGAVAASEPSAARADREQIEVDLPDVPVDVERLVVVLYLNPGSRANRALRQLRELRLRVLDAAGGAELVRSENLVGALTGPETAAVLGELYRHRGGWKVRVVGQGYSTGIAGVAADLGLAL